MTEGLSPDTNPNSNQPVNIVTATTSNDNATNLSRRASKISQIDEVVLLANPPQSNELYPKTRLDRTSSTASQSSLNNNAHSKNGTVSLFPSKIVEDEREHATTIDDPFPGPTTGTYRRNMQRHPSYAGSHHIDNRLSYLRPTSRMQRPISVSGHSAAHSHHSHDVPPPTSAKDKSKMTRRYFATVSGISYAILIIVLGLIIFIGSGLVDLYPIPEVFSIVLIGMSSAYLIYLLIDIRMHVNNAKKTMREREKIIEMYENQQAAKIETMNGTANGITFEFPTFPNFNAKPISHRYCFVTGRHGELVYLKFGAAWFGLGLLIHSILLLVYQIIFMTSTDPNYIKCASAWKLAFEACFAAFALLLLFFIFKYINIIINECRGLARLAFMHIFGTVLAFWVFTIVRETTDLIRLSEMKTPKVQWPSNASVVIVKSVWQSFAEQPHSDICPDADGMNTILQTFSPYLYPFIIEFFILVSGIIYMIWAHINKCAKKAAEVEHKKATEAGSHSHNPTPHGHTNNHGMPAFNDDNSHCDNPFEHDNNYKSNIFVYADCHAVSRGLFAGLLLMVATVVFIILFFVATDAYDPDNPDEGYFWTGVLVNGIFQLVVMVIMIVCVIFAYIQTSRLDVNTHPVSKLDDILLFVAIPAFFSETIFSLVPAIDSGNVVNILNIAAQIIQILIQTPWIIDGMRRCANAVQLRKEKPGRELITFLTIANVSLWIFYAFSAKNRYVGDERYEFYGYPIWTILNHLSLPLIMFYRFHASVCLVDIWKHAYEPGGGH